ncbi:subclass B3 metallo-beta-lactamase [Chitiniphilus purpureus]|uniref:Subclass B3 metallo-beta-lactamase n=1 Tax=Chitiniphilus purpureus TaxID=2981137 RepID=A0ABY6DPC8_9NEIS|nr:subclass B3 metallo-beta-lactamase [Chitiniphilus sp. CD1]UXY16083.1 subclass B3 metallo-beta-lactamase [Chitiniphilus sp. CD1]
MKALLTLATLLGSAAWADQAAWDAPQAPFALYGNTYYVGPRGLSAVLITSPAGHILIDGGSPRSPQQIARRIRQLGFRPEDIRYILNSHPHFDHAGGIAWLQRLSGATVLSSAWGVAVLRHGRPLPDDPQYGGLADFAAVRNTRAVADGEVIRLGPLAVTAHFTPGHTPGGVSWTWQATEHGRTASLVYADSLSAYGGKRFRYSGDRAYPEAKADVERSIARIAALPCDILIAAHPEAGGLWARQARQPERGNAAFIDPHACRRYAEQGRARLAERLAEEAAQH